MSGFVLSGIKGVNLQGTLSAASAVAGHPVSPHHPITCSSDLRFEPDGQFACPHASVPATSDLRTRQCLEHSISILLIEMAVKLYGDGGTNVRG